MKRAVARPIALTFAGEVASTVATVWVTRRVAVGYPGIEVAGYLVLRQVLNWVLGVGMLGLNVSLPRALANHAARDERRHRMAAALTLAAPVVGLIGLTALLAPRAAALVLLHDPSADRLLTAACFLIGANGLFAVAAAALQGLDRFGTLALGRVFAFGVGPVAVVAALGARASLPSVLWVWGAATLAVDFVLAVAIARALAASPAGSRAAVRPKLAATCRGLLGYGGPRMIGAIAQLSTVALAPTLALWCGATPGEAAALSVAAMFGVLMGPARLALQPVALTRLAERPPVATARPLAQAFLAAAACAAAGFGGALATSGDRLVALWLGDGFLASATVLRFSTVAVTLQFFCYTLEGILDADDPRHLRPRAQLASAALFGVGVLAALALHAGAGGILVAQVAASLAQTALYLRLVAIRYGLPRAREVAHGALTVGGAALAIGLAARLLPPGATATLLISLAQLAVAVALIALARASGVRWPRLLLGENGPSSQSAGKPGSVPLARQRSFI